MTVPFIQENINMFTYKTNCVNYPDTYQTQDIEPLHDMIDNAIDITRETFLQHVDRQDLLTQELNLSYSAHWKQGLTMSADWAVSYHRSKLFGKRVYYFRQSAIEYIFTEV